MAFMLRSLVAQSTRGAPLRAAVRHHSLLRPSLFTRQRNHHHAALNSLFHATSDEQRVKQRNNNMSSQAALGYRMLSTKPTPEPTPTPLNALASDSDDDEKKNKEAAAPVGRLRQAWNQYGWVAVGTYVGVYFGTLATLTSLVSMDVIGAGGAIEVFRFLHIDSLIDLDLIDPKLGNLALAWVLTKVVEPARLVVSLAITPSIARIVNPMWKKRVEEKAEEKEAAKKDEKES